MTVFSVRAVFENRPSAGKINFHEVKSKKLRIFVLLRFVLSFFVQYLHQEINQNSCQISESDLSAIRLSTRY